MAPPLVSIIIPARDEEPNIKRCLQAVNRQETDFSYETIVVDSGSKDGTAKAAATLGARVISIKREEFQHGRTRQMASNEANGEFLVYLVADAEPANERWLSSLVEAVASDERAAGAYSRQIPRREAGPIEEFRLRHRLSSGNEKETREIGESDFWAIQPEERFRMCEFDDVSCCRRRSLMDRFPIPEVDWAEDLLWAKDVLLAGHRIVFEPRSVVRHSHPDTIGHAFRRGYLDQEAVKAGFGVLYFGSVGEALRGYPRMVRDQAGAISLSEPCSMRSMGLNVWNAGRTAAEIAGNWCAAKEREEDRTVHDLAGIMGGTSLRRVRKGSVMKTRFTVGEDVRKTLFMNPQARATAYLFIPEGARLRLGAAINPEARAKREAPVTFIVLMDEEPLWVKEVWPGKKGDKPAWTDTDLDLAKWAGRRTRVTLATRSENTDYGWAGWGAPVIYTAGPGIRERALNALLDRARTSVKRGPLRHP